MRKNTDAAAVYGEELQAASKKYWGTLTKGEKVAETLSTILMVITFFVGLYHVTQAWLEFCIVIVDKVMQFFNPEKEEVLEDESDFADDELNRFST